MFTSVLLPQTLPSAAAGDLRQAHQEALRRVATSMAVARAQTRIVSGRDQVLALKDTLLALSRRYDQAGAIDHLEYFLAFKESSLKTPHVVLIGECLHAADPSSRIVLGALLIHEHRIFGLSLKIFTTDDVSGRRTLIAPESARVACAKLAAAALMKAGARAAVQSFANSEPMPTGPTRETSSSKEAIWAESMNQRVTRSYLPIESTLDATFAKIGQRTRSNMRYYRRRAMAQLGCHFVEQVQIDRSDFIAFNRLCAFAVSDEQAAWRYDSLQNHPGMVLCGIQDGQGRWLSLVGGRRYSETFELDWQMNRNDLPAYSLSHVMRACLIEHEVGLGTRRLYIEGGSPQALQFSMTTHVVNDLAVVRNSRMIHLMRRSVPFMLKVVNRFVPKSNLPLRLLTDKKLYWRAWS